MTIKEALKSIPDSSELQPTGQEVADAYSRGMLQDPTENLYLITWLLHLVNNPSAKVRIRDAS